MKTRRKNTALVRRLYILLLITLAVPVGVGIAGRTLNLEKVIPSDFPTRVSGIVFEDGTRMDTTEPQGFGEWTVAFGQATPMATYECPYPCVRVSPIITIEVLECSSPMFGTVQCGISMTMGKGGPTECSVTLSDADPPSVPIECPVRLESN